MGVLSGELSVLDGETIEFRVIVTSENGEQKEYTLKIERISSNLEIDSITVTDYDDTKTDIVTKNVVNYDKDTKTYKIKLSGGLADTKISINALSSFTEITFDELITAKGSITADRILPGLGVTRYKIDLVAADGNKDTRYLEIVQLSDEIGIIEVRVDNVIISQNVAGDYECTVTNAEDLANVKVTVSNEKTKISINNNIETVQANEINISKGNARQVKVPIRVTAEDGTSYTYMLTINILSVNTSVRSVKANGEEAKFEKAPDLVDGEEQVRDKYISYIDKYAYEVEIEITAGVPYSEVSHEMADGSIVLGKDKITFKHQTTDLTEEEFTTEFMITAEDGTEKSYDLILKRRSDDNSIKIVYVNDVETPPNSKHLEYADGTYYRAVVGDTAKVKIETNNEFASISFNGKLGVNILEQTLTLDKNSKVTEIPVRITSQQGTIYDTVIYIEKVSNNCNLELVLVNEEASNPGLDPDTFITYIYDTAKNARVKIMAENDLAEIVITNKER